MDEFNLRKNQRRQKLQKGKLYKREKDKESKKKPRNDSVLVNVFNDTINWFKERDLQYEESEVFDINNIDISFDGLTTRKDVEVVVANIDSFVMAENFLKSRCSSVLVLNMASAYKPGGGVLNGKTAQEESLFRRSSAFLSHSEHLYPLSENTVLFTPKVTVIKDEKHEMLEHPFDVSMVTVSALRKPVLENGVYFEDDFNLMQRKIESIFKIGISKKVDCLVLGALGCGVYNNPPEEVSRIMSMMIQRYGHHFSKIGFAILCVRDRDYDNLKQFEKLTRFNQK